MILNIELAHSFNSHLSLVRTDALLFGEDQSRIVVSCSPENFSDLRNVARKNEVPFSKLGEVGGDRLVIRRDKGSLIDISIDELGEKWQKGLTRCLK